MDQALLESVRAGDPQALARAITLVEKGSSPGPVSAAGHIIGITGPPGVGKSTLISSLIELLRSSGETVLAVSSDC